jgi:DNA-binding FadR family transcriptional regulator
LIRHGYPPAESDIAAAMCVSAPSVNQMVKTLEKKALILRHPGQPGSLQLLISADEIPRWNSGKPSQNSAPSVMSARRLSATAANLYVLSTVA